jgi:prepilin-type processing-associated H-X9-DG protein
MKLRGSNSSDQGLTLVEVVVVIFSLFILAATLLATVSAPRIRNSVGCVNQLKQASLAVGLSAGDGHYQPVEFVPATNGPALEPGGAGTAEALFQALANEFGSPRILVCPADAARLPAASFRSLKADNLSYFINVNHRESLPQAFLMGDDNLDLHGARVKSGLLEVAAKAPLAWSPERHRFYGNIAFGDGSVQGLSNAGLRERLHSTHFTAMRLAIP